MHDDSERDQFDPDLIFEPMQLLGYDLLAFEVALAKNLSAWDFECESVGSDGWRLTHLRGASRFVLLRREPTWHIEAYGFGPKVADGSTLKIPRVPDASAFGANWTRAERAETLAEIVARHFATRVWPRLLSRRERPRRRRPR